MKHVIREQLASSVQVCVVMHAGYKIFVSWRLGPTLLKDGSNFSASSQSLCRAKAPTFGFLGIRKQSQSGGGRDPARVACRVEPPTGAPAVGDSTKVCDDVCARDDI